MVGKDRAPYVIDLDVAVNALKDMKSYFANINKNLRKNKVDIAKKVKDITPPSFKGKTYRSRTMPAGRGSFDNVEEVEIYSNRLNERRAH